MNLDDKQWNSQEIQDFLREHTEGLRAKLPNTPIVVLAVVRTLPDGVPGHAIVTNIVDEYLPAVLEEVASAYGLKLKDKEWIDEQ